MHRLHMREVRRKFKNAHAHAHRALSPDSLDPSHARELNSRPHGSGGEVNKVPKVQGSEFRVDFRV